jgi:hypothetical protein
LKETPQAASIEVHVPESDSASIAVNVNHQKGTFGLQIIDILTNIH